jgi:hypothetical protein
VRGLRSAIEQAALQARLARHPVAEQHKPCGPRDCSSRALEFVKVATHGLESLMREAINLSREAI